MSEINKNKQDASKSLVLNDENLFYYVSDFLDLNVNLSEKFKDNILNVSQKILNLNIPNIAGKLSVSKSMNIIDYCIAKSYINFMLSPVTKSYNISDELSFQYKEVNRQVKVGNLSKGMKKLLKEKKPF